MAQKFLTNNAGAIKEVEATVTSAGAGDSGKLPALDTDGRLNSSVMPSGFGAEVKVVAASENLAAGDFVNLHVSTGLKVRKADASNPAKFAVGYVLAAVTSGQNATIYYGNLNTQVSGLTAGDVLYLSGGTAGGVTATAPSTSGYIVQRLGVATSATEVLVEIQQPIELA